MATQTAARTEFSSALNQICAERGIEPEVVLETIEVAILAAYRKDYGLEEEIEYEVEIDPLTGAASIFKKGEKGKMEDVTPPGFGRIAAQTAKQVILQRVREAEKDAIIAEYSKKVKTILSGMVLRFDGPNIIVDIGRGQGVMPPQEQVRTERYRLNQRLAFYIADIRETLKGKAIIVSRAHPGLIEELFRREVPEVTSGAVEIKAIAREPGNRTKIAVTSTQEGVDPVGSCVGQRGVRVQAVINELAGEKIDIIQYADNPQTFIAQALAPADGIKVEIEKDGRKATVTVPDDQLSLAIGRGGQNVRLAAKLTGYKIDIQGESGEKAISVTGEEEYEIDSLKLTARVRKVLVDAGITSLESLKERKEEELKHIKGLGPKAIAEIKERLAQ
ncbi:MAG: transcription termination factor NusA [Candidatus Chisholmbacteria bacterium RIFCSPLOWO2_01_FULL_50_28]|uniref:Transcription termination/antitermination protein NusA n=1 Tax=Candidatus Chisholmbacteria bacterium RIFCSPHIGHO2_01_FULL_52_32 TaxID=1797591 RepID=A0A1G1VTZ3_9BACT|nr:MAG: transcription termination factor NusA [Candidatus Chisholmbacteria bacterium RIFCSPHIGHO2_01_FULL_52_32]OGY19754.1 MAG: transcription termination factor NusA [Candidatus Chisholmbacteria bacterium RIFCSPLOWO2_01_FULL_50_28]